MRWRSGVIAVLGAVMVMAAGGANAQLLLSDLIATGGTVTVGDKVFSGFGYAHTGDMPDATGVTVTGLFVAGNPGLQFQGGFHSNPGDTSDALITYVVTATGGNIITDAHLDGNPAVVGGTGALSVTESFTPDAPNTMSIFDIVPGSTKVSDATVFTPPLTSLHVQKDILGVGGTGLATMSFVNQSYSEVPEPGSLAFLAGVLVPGAFLLRRRSR